jgi:ribosomal protein L24E
MTFLYRFAIAITRKQPYLDWANSLEADGPELTAELADDRRTIYLVPESPDRPDLKRLLDRFWEQMFEEELASWILDGEAWPKALTREMFDAWFDTQLTDSVFDLTPDEPLTQADVEADDLDYAVHHCAWCGIEIDAGAGRYVSFKLAHRARFAHREGLAFPLEVDAERFAVGIMTREESEASLRGDDIVFRACTSACEKGLRKAVPKALRQELKAHSTH